jgi:hypothetical protein
MLAAAASVGVNIKIGYPEDTREIGPCRNSAALNASIGRFFQFQRSFSRNGQRRAAPNRNQAVRSSDALHQMAPIQFGGGGKAIWQSLQRASQRLILGP